MTGNMLLLTPKDFPEPALGPVAQRCLTNRRGGGDYTDPRGLCRGRRGFPKLPPNGKGPAIHAAALLPDGADFGLTTQVLLGAESHLSREQEPT